MSDTPEETEVEVGPADNIEVSPLSAQQNEGSATEGEVVEDEPGEDDE